MRRLTIEGDWIRTIDDEGWGIKPPSRDGSPQAFLCVPDCLVTSVEDVPDPLPTEPGATFWGKCNASDPQRWFVQRLGIGDHPTDLVYCPADKTLGADDINASSAKRAGLVVLPEPEVAP